MNHLSGLSAVPLFTHDPFFSLWDTSPLPTAGDVRHWTGAEKPITGNIEIDGEKMRFFGRMGKKPMKFVDISVTPLSSVYTFEAGGIRLKVRFTSPLLLDDPDVLSTPVSFMDLFAESIDGKDHSVAIEVKFFTNLVYSGENMPPLRTDSFTDGALSVAYMGKLQQTLLSESGDHATIDWGYLFAASDAGSFSFYDGFRTALIYKFEAKTPFSANLLVGYEDVASVQYFGKVLKAYYQRNGKTITDALREFHLRHDELIARCDAFDEQLLRDAYEAGGESYQKIVTASYRQSIAAHKLVAGENGEMLFISKENDSNGCAATADVSYPSVPLYLLYQPELVRGMCRPILRFARCPVWTYDFAPHDAGRYPILDGQVYGSLKRDRTHETGHTPAPLYLYPASAECFTLERQMPVEESANMLLMIASVGYADGDWSMAAENLDLLRKWCKYLLEFGEDPGEQLCTDDFAGHLARNVNLAAKAVMGVAAFGMILTHTGDPKEGEAYLTRAKEMAKSWLGRASSEDGHTYLTFDQKGWSQKYNVVWDKLFHFDLLPDEFYEKELSFYVSRMNEYGLPLDSRSDYTKSDWTMWVASLCDTKEEVERFTKPLAHFLAETPVRIPFGDWYDTVTGCPEKFIARSVQAGVFMVLLMKKWAKKQ